MAEIGARLLAALGAIPGAGEAYASLSDERQLAPRGLESCAVSTAIGTRIEVWIESRAATELVRLDPVALAPPRDERFGAFVRLGTCDFPDVSMVTFRNAWGAVRTLRHVRWIRDGVQYRASGVFDETSLEVAKRISPLLSLANEMAAFYPGLGLRPPVPELASLATMARNAEGFDPPKPERPSGPSPKTTRSAKKSPPPTTGLSDTWGAPSTEHQKAALGRARTQARWSEQWHAHHDAREREAVRQSTADEERKEKTATKATPKKDTPKKAAPKKATPKKATPKKATPKKATSKKATSKKATR